ncbi:hypothetical protein FRC02_004522 [Tulasnella sp. 418]|nr:hypothetical protein FRC02_004522 [Tulasnella sp. 418]
MSSNIHNLCSNSPTAVTPHRLPSLNPNSQSFTHSTVHTTPQFHNRPHTPSVFSPTPSPSPFSESIHGGRALYSEAESPRIQSLSAYPTGNIGVSAVPTPGSNPNSMSSTHNLHTNSPHPALTTGFVDALATNAGLTPEQRNDFHIFSQAILQMPSGFHPAFLMLQATMLTAFNKINHNDELMREMANALSALEARLGSTFELGKTAKDNIYLVAKELLLEDTRTIFSSLHLDIDRFASRNAELLQYPVKLSPAHQRKLVAIVRKTASSARCLFRRDILTSIKTRQPLPEFTISIINKYFTRSEGTKPPPTERLQIQLAIYRKVARETVSTDASEREVQLVDDSDEAELIEAPPKKRKRTNNGAGKAVKDEGDVSESFWGIVEEFFRSSREKWGDNITHRAWKIEIQRILDLDRYHYPPNEVRGQGKEKSSTSLKTPTGIFGGLMQSSVPCSTPAPTPTILSHPSNHLHQLTQGQQERLITNSLPPPASTTTGFQFADGRAASHRQFAPPQATHFGATQDSTSLHHFS